LSLRQKVQEVEEVFSLLSKDMSAFQDWSKLSCKTGCGKCCTKADIEATVLEFIPFAYHVYMLRQSEQWLDRLKTHGDDICLFFNPTAAGLGSCSQYKHRGLICRLFGFSARTNKYANREFVSCQTIKTEQADGYQLAFEKVRSGDAIPVMNQYYMRLVGIDPLLAREFFPINEAIRRAVETVLHHYTYQEEEGRAADQSETGEKG
jgi:uncharacterized protein